MKNLLLLPLLFLSTLLCAQQPMTEFDSLKLRIGVNVKISEDLKVLDIPYLHKIPHQLAVGPEDSSYQIRYWIFPLDTYLSLYNNKSKKEQKESMAPNQLCKSMMMLAVLNTSNNKEQNYYESEYPDLTKKAYNADWEASTIVETGWPQVGYKYCYIWTLHRDNAGQIFIYILVNKKEDIFKAIAKVVPGIKFN